MWTTEDIIQHMKDVEVYPQQSRPDFDSILEYEADKKLVHFLADTLSTYIYIYDEIVDRILASVKGSDEFLYWHQVEKYLSEKTNSLRD